MIRDYLVERARKELNDELQKEFSIFPVTRKDSSIVDGARMSLRDILRKVLVRYPVEPGHTIRLKLSGDGRNIGKKRKQVMLTFCLLNQGNLVLKPENQYSLYILVGTEDYDMLKVNFKS